jgi:hypothetical protein
MADPTMPSLPDEKRQSADSRRLICEPQFVIDISRPLICRCRPLVASDLRSEMPCILDVDTIAIKPCSEQSKRLLLLNQAGANIDIEQLEAPGEQTATNRYRFVYQLMPFDPTLPNLVASVIP